MPSLKDSLENAKNPKYVPVPAAPSVVELAPPIFTPTTNQRFILPPFNTDPDSLRQFEVGTSGPKIRIWPAPQQKALAPSSPANTTIIETSSSGGGTTLIPVAAALTTGSLPAGTNYQTRLNFAAVYLLLNMSVNGPCEVRIYGSQQAQIFDASRVTGNPVPPEISQNIITCVTFDTNPYTWTWQNRVGINGDNPQLEFAYISVFNTNPASAAPVTVVITYLPLGQ